MAADKWKIYNEFTQKLGDGTIDLDNDVFKMALFLSTSNAATLTTVGKAALTNEHANANGYTTGGITLTTVTWTPSGATLTFNCDDAVWTASGGSIQARYAVIYDETAVGDPLVCFCLLDNTPADITATDGNTFTVTIHVNGVFTMAANNA